MKYNSLNNGRLQLTSDGLVAVEESVTYRKSKFRHGRIASMYVVDGSTQARECAAKCLERMLSDADTDVYVVTDHPERFADMPENNVICLQNATKRLLALYNEMEERIYDLMTEGLFTVEDYNAKHADTPKKIVYVVVDALDEYLAQNTDLAYPIIRISQKGRAAGINVVACACRMPQGDYETSIKNNCHIVLWADGIVALPAAQ